MLQVDVCISTVHTVVCVGWTAAITLRKGPFRGHVHNRSGSLCTEVFCAELREHSLVEIIREGANTSIRRTQR